VTFSRTPLLISLSECILKRHRTSMWTWK